MKLFNILYTIFLVCFFGFLIFALSGCDRDTPPVTQTLGGSVVWCQDENGYYQIHVSQPSNPDESAFLEVLTESGDTIRAGTGSSRKDEAASLKIKLGQYEVFTYVGAGVCVLGVALLIASFWFPLIPKLAGPMVFAGGALTAYMSTAIPEYGPYFLIISLVGAVAWYYNHTAGRKDPKNFQRKPKSK